MPEPEKRLTGGALNAAIADAIVAIVADYAGRGPERSRAFIHDDVVVCLLAESMTKAERNLVRSGKDDVVRTLRDAFQRATEPSLVAAVEQLTGRKVVTFLSGSSTGADTSVEMFVLAPEDLPA